MQEQISRLNPEWVRQARDYFKEFLKETRFPNPLRNGSRGSEFSYPEWLIMFIAVVSLKCKVKTYRGIHRLALQYWHIITEGIEGGIKPISESQLRERLKKISHAPGRPAGFIFQVFSGDQLN
jgi:hypothetical protein